MQILLRRKPAGLLTASMASPESPREKSERILKPGVHADVGGGSDGKLLNDISLLTMIDRAREYCPEIEWDPSFLKDLEDKLKPSEDQSIKLPEVIISDARPDVCAKTIEDTSEEDRLLVTRKFTLLSII